MSLLSLLSFLLYSDIEHIPFIIFVIMAMDKAPIIISMTDWRTLSKSLK
jgi:hypothetical protein